ncbi:MAG: hypothetical protein QOD07_556 [Frankiaceae bacterium]|jgi:hypothetical protein|nr:hypothetical protein [Frankiaceae bacterium]
MRLPNVVVTTTPAPPPAPPPAPAPAPADTPRGTDWQAATEQVRSTSATITKAFVALGTLLVGAGPLLVKFSNLPTFPAWLFAALGALVALFGIGYVIQYASSVMLPQTPDVVELASATTGCLGELRRHIEDLPGGRQLYLGGDTTIDGLVQEANRWRTTYTQLSVLAPQAEAIDKNPSYSGPLPESLADPIARATLPRALAAARAQVEAINLRFARLLQQASYVKVRDAFDQARPRMFVGAALTAVGTMVYLGAFGIDLGKDSGSGTAATATTAATASGAKPAVLTWATATAKGSDDRPVDAVRTDLGLSDSSCDQIPVLVEGSGSANDPWNVTTLSGGLCTATPRTFSIDKGVATLVTAEPTTYELAPTRRKDASTGELVGTGAGAVAVGVLGGWLLWRRRRTSDAQT